MTHRDRAGDPSGQRAGRWEAAGDAGHRQGFPTPSGGSPARPEAASQGFRTAMAFRRGARLAMPRIATPRAPGRKPWETAVPVAQANRRRASESLADVLHRLRLPSYAPVGPADRLHDLYGSLSTLLGIR